MRLSEFSASQCAGQLLDSSSLEAQWSAGSVHLAKGTVARHRVLVAATDRTRAGGALGTEECSGLEAALQRARGDACAMVLLLASGGAHLDQGLAALGAFRRLFAAVLAARQAGVRLLAVIHGACFGGASMLACVCPQRIGIEGGQLGLSGPGIIEALGGTGELDASNREDVRRLFGVEARHAGGILPRLCPDQTVALRAALGAALVADETERLPEKHAALRERLRRRGLVLPRQTPSWSGFAGTGAVSARDCWLAADWLLQQEGKELDVMLDAPGQATTRLDEQLGLSEFVVHLARCLMHLRERGAAMNLQIVGEAAGAIYVALAAPASRVIARSGACVRVLPPQAVSRILGTGKPHEEDIGRARECGVVDEILP